MSAHLPELLPGCRVTFPHCLIEVPRLSARALARTASSSLGSKALGLVGRSGQVVFCSFFFRLCLTVFVSFLKTVFFRLFPACLFKSLVLGCKDV